MKKIIQTDKAPAAVGPYSQGVQAGNFFFLSGQIPLHPQTGEVVGTTVQEQAKQVIENIIGVLGSQQLSLDHIVKATVFLQNMGDFASFNEVYKHYFTHDFPARSTIEVARLPKDVLIEIEVIAYSE